MLLTIAPSLIITRLKLKNETSDSLDSLPKIEKGETIISANKEYKDLKELTFDKKKMNVQYKGDAWLSPYRGGSNEILLIVDDTLFKEINVKEKTRQILSFNKSFGNLNLVNQGKAPELSEEIDKVNTALDTKGKRAVIFINITKKVKKPIWIESFHHYIEKKYNY